MKLFFAEESDGGLNQQPSPSSDGGASSLENLPGLFGRAPLAKYGLLYQD